MGLVIDPLRAAGVADPHTVARGLVAVLRREDPSAPGVRATAIGR
ncbi:hypothetical protein [Actinomadura napierensis]|uniref:Uncharacterized protein n=1 Tax=Actinomadura napierensis TaxID=267854 RepID=A0ABP5M7U3_9ACTN